MTGVTIRRVEERDVAALARMVTALAAHHGDDMFDAVGLFGPSLIAQRLGIAQQHRNDRGMGSDDDRLRVGGRRCSNSPPERSGERWARTAAHPSSVIARLDRAIHPALVQADMWTRIMGTCPPLPTGSRCQGWRISVPE